MWDIRKPDDEPPPPRTEEERRQLTVGDAGAFAEDNGHTDLKV